MERPKRNNTIEKDYRERKRQKKGETEEKVHKKKRKFEDLHFLIFLFFIFMAKSNTLPILTTTIKEDPQSLFEQLYKDVVNYRDPEE